MIELDSDISYKEAPRELIALICNGCGAAGAKFDFVPDSIYKMSITAACQVHDWDYHIGKTIEYKELADRRFFNNMLRLIEAQTKKRWLRVLMRRRALKYYEAVYAFGGPAFWNLKNNGN